MGPHTKEAGAGPADSQQECFHGEGMKRDRDLKAGALFQDEICLCCVVLRGNTSCPADMHMIDQAAEASRQEKQKKDFSVGFQVENFDLEESGNDYNRNLKGCRKGFLCCGQLIAGQETTGCMSERICRSWGWTRFAGAGIGRLGLARRQIYASVKKWVVQ